MKILEVMMLCIGFSVCCNLAAQTVPPQLVFEVDTDRKNGMYSSGETISFNFMLKEDGKPLPGKKYKYVVTQDGAEKTEGEGTTTDKTAAVSVKASEVPGWTRFEVFPVNEKGNRISPSGEAGAITDADKIQAGAAYPSDFKEFWKKEIDEMKKSPMSPELTEVEITDENFKGKVRAFKLKLDCGNGNFAYGYISVPLNAKEKSLPAIIQFHGASTVGVSKVPLHYAGTAIHMTMSPHSAESGLSREAYAEFRAKYLAGYPSRDADNKEKYYMKGMILRVVRAFEYVKTRPEWNGKDLIAHGESQGGFQAIAAAALDRDITLCVAMVPAMSDHLGYKKGRRNGWPLLVKLKDDCELNEFYAKAAENAPYFDCVNFARLIRCPIWLSTGLLDTTCCPSGVFAVYNNIPPETEKHMFVAPRKGHDAGNKDVVQTLKSILVPESQE